MKIICKILRSINFVPLSFGRTTTNYHIDEAAVMSLFGELRSTKVIVKPNGTVWREELAHIDNIVCHNLG